MGEVWKSSVGLRIRNPNICRMHCDKKQWPMYVDSCEFEPKRSVLKAVKESELAFYYYRKR